MKNLDYDIILNNTSKDLNIELTNNGDDVVVKSVEMMKGDKHSVDPTPSSPVEIKKDDILNIKCTFSPDINGEFADTIIVSISEPCDTIIKMPVFGIAKLEIFTITTLPDTSSIPGNPNFVIPLKARFDYDTTLVLDFEAEIRFDASAYEPDKQPIGSIINYKRVIRITGDSVEISPKEKIIAKLSGMVLLGAKDENPLKITEFKWTNNDDVIPKTVDGNLLIEGVCFGDFRRVERIEPEYVNIYPNPVEDAAEIIIENIDENDLKLMLCDIHGKRQQLSWDKIITNKNSNVSKIKLSTQDISSGFYILLIRTKFNIFHKPLMIVH